MCSEPLLTMSKSRLRRTSVLASIAVGLALSSAAGAQAANNPGTGDTGFFTFRPSAVAGTQINVASGNALVRTRDLADSDGNYHVVVDRAYNSLASDAFSILSPRWGFDVGPATKLAVQNNGDALVTGPSGYRVLFSKQATGTFTAPAGFDGSLVASSSGWTLSRTSQGDQFGFNGSGQLAWTKDSQARDFTVQGTSAAGRDVLSSYGTNSGRRVNLSYNGDSLVREMDDPSSGHHYYGYTNGKLTSYRSPSGAETTYHYATNGYLDKITEAGGTTVELTTTSAGKVQSITTTLPGAVGQTTSFVYTRRPYKTDVTGPDGVRRTYAYDDDWRVTRQYNPDVTPTLTASGPLYDLADDYTNGQAAINVSVRAAEPDGAGVDRLAVEEIDGAELGHFDAACTTTPFDRICPTDTTGTFSADLTGLSEGAHELQATGRDDENHVTASDPWTVLVDRTAPAFGTGASNDPDEDSEMPVLASDSQESASLISWPDADDPELVDGNPGSGIGHYQWRYRASSTASWSAWSTTPDDGTDVQIDTAVDHLELQVVPVDQVGNVGASHEWSIDEAPQDETPVPDYVPDPETVEDDEAPFPDDEPSLVEDDSDPSPSARAVTVRKNYKCKQEWAPIQAVSSGFVIGNCSEDTRVTAYRRQTYKNFPGAEGEGKVWVAGSLADGASFTGCGWLSVARRLTAGGSGSGNPLCRTYNRANKATYMHVARRRPGSVPAPTSKHYPKFYIWATVRKNEQGKLAEQDGLRSRVTQACTGYANINPWKKNQRASGRVTEKFEVDDHVAIRYLSRYRAKNPMDNDKLEYWIMTHTGRADTPWLWLPASCHFQLDPKRANG